MEAGKSFKGKATMGDFTVDFEWKFETVDMDAKTFTFSQILSSDGQILEQSGGSGVFTSEEDIHQLVFQDDQTNFNGNFNAKTGKFIGEAAQKDGCGTGNFDLNLA